MIKKMISVLLLSVICAGSIFADEPRRSRKRPSSMVHTEAEVKNASKVTKLTGRYIRDNSVFEGKVYMTDGLGTGIEIGTARISFSGDRYTLDMDAAEFETRTSTTRKERRDKGITEYEYDHSWENQKIGKDFDYSGKYEIAEQYDKISLILYDGNSSNIYAKIPLSSANDSSFEFSEDDFLIQFTPVE